MEARNMALWEDRKQQREAASGQEEDQSGNTEKEWHLPRRKVAQQQAAVGARVHENGDRARAPWRKAGFARIKTACAHCCVRASRPCVHVASARAPLSRRRSRARARRPTRCCAAGIRAAAHSPRSAATRRNRRRAAGPESRSPGRETGGEGSRIGSGEASRKRQSARSGLSQVDLPLGPPRAYASPIWPVVVDASRPSAAQVVRSYVCY
eukprot:3338752-Pleurochrysis_carterae.AAC.1